MPTQALRIDPCLPGAHFARAEALLLRGDWARGWEEYEWRFRIRGAAPLMPPTTKPQWDGPPLGEQHVAADRRPGFWRRHPVLPLYPVGGRALPATSRSPAAPRWRRCCASCIPTRICSSAGRTARPMRRSARCRACRGCTARGWTTCRQPTPYLRADPAARRAVEERLDGLVPPGYPPHRARLGRPADAQQRPQPLGATWPTFAPLGGVPRDRAGGAAERPADGAGRSAISAARR